MARINSTDVIQKAVNDLGLSQSVDKIPNDTLDKIQLVYFLNREYSDFVANIQGSTTGTLTCTVADTKKDFYMTGMTVAFIKDATCDIATGQLVVGVTINGVAKNFKQFPVITLTAQSESATLTFPFPIKVDRNTNITFSGGFTVGVCTRSMAVYGFYRQSSL